jgi:hypothetical protein
MHTERLVFEADTINTNTSHLHIIFKVTFFFMSCILVRSKVLMLVTLMSTTSGQCDAV